MSAHKYKLSTPVSPRFGGTDGGSTGSPSMHASPSFTPSLDGDRTNVADAANSNDDARTTSVRNNTLSRHHGGHGHHDAETEHASASSALAAARHSSAVAPIRIRNSSSTGASLRFPIRRLPAGHDRLLELDVGRVALPVSIHVRFAPHFKGIGPTPDALCATSELTLYVAEAPTARVCDYRWQRKVKFLDLPHASAPGAAPFLADERKRPAEIHRSTVDARHGVNTEESANADEIIEDSRKGEFAAVTFLPAPQLSLSNASGVLYMSVHSHTMVRDVVVECRLGSHATSCTPDTDGKDLWSIAADPIPSIESFHEAIRWVGARRTALVLKTTVLINDKGETPLHVLCANCGDSRLARVLTANCARFIDPEKRDDTGCTAVMRLLRLPEAHNPAHPSHPRCIQLLKLLVEELAVGLDQQDTDGNTVLHYLCKYHRLDSVVAKMLWSHGAGMFVARTANNAGLRPLDIAEDAATALLPQEVEQLKALFRQEPVPPQPRTLRIIDRLPALPLQATLDAVCPPQPFILDDRGQPRFEESVKENGNGSAMIESRPGEDGSLAIAGRRQSQATRSGAAASFDPTMSAQVIAGPTKRRSEAHLVTFSEMPTRPGDMTTSLVSDPSRGTTITHTAGRGGGLAGAIGSSMGRTQRGTDGGGHGRPGALGAAGGSRTQLPHIGARGAAGVAGSGGTTLQVPLIPTAQSDTSADVSFCPSVQDHAGHHLKNGPGAGAGSAGSLLPAGGTFTRGVSAVAAPGVASFISHHGGGGARSGSVVNADNSVFGNHFGKSVVGRMGQSGVSGVSGPSGAGRSGTGGSSGTSAARSTTSRHLPGRSVGAGNAQALLGVDTEFDLSVRSDSNTMSSGTRTFRPQKWGVIGGHPVLDDDDVTLPAETAANVRAELNRQLQRTLVPTRMVANGGATVLATRVGPAYTEDPVGDYYAEKAHAGLSPEQQEAEMVEALARLREHNDEVKTAAQVSNAQQQQLHRRQLRSEKAVREMVHAERKAEAVYDHSGFLTQSSEQMDNSRSLGRSQSPRAVQALTSPSGLGAKTFFGNSNNGGATQQQERGGVKSPRHSPRRAHQHPGTGGGFIGGVPTALRSPGQGELMLDSTAVDAGPGSAKALLAKKRDQPAAKPERPPLLDTRRLQEEFARFDVNGNGYLSRPELAAVYRAYDHYGVVESHSEMEALVESLGVARDGKVTFDEFLLLIVKLSRR